MAVPIFLRNRRVGPKWIVNFINDALATLFREREGLVAASETLRTGTRPDIIVRTSDAPVIIEVELEPARTLEADALSRLGVELDVSVGNPFLGKIILCSLAVGVSRRRIDNHFLVSLSFISNSEYLLAQDHFHEWVFFT